jgi:hypothetical protein
MLSVGQQPTKVSSSLLRTGVLIQSLLFGGAEQSKNEPKKNDSSRMLIPHNGSCGDITMAIRISGHGNTDDNRITSLRRRRGSFFC